jgi:hypothetical protein
MSERQKGEAAQLDEARVLAEVYLLADDNKLTPPARLFKRRLADAILKVVRRNDAVRKRSRALSFLGGVLVVTTGGSDEHDGSGHIALDEAELRREPNEKADGYTCWVAVQKSELIALRDFLNERFPPAAGSAAE